MPGVSERHDRAKLVGGALPISLVGLASALPEAVVPNDFFGEESRRTKSKMFAGAEKRRHIAREQTASDLIESAALKLIRETNLDPGEIDVILTNVSVPDQPFTGCGAVVNGRIGARAEWIFDIHNTGCVSFLYMIELARSLMASHGGKTALICCVQTAGGRIFSQPGVRNKAQAAIPGDGCGVGLLRASGENPVLAFVQHSYSEYADDMYVTCDGGRKWWEPGEQPGYIDFTESRIARITVRGNRLVPAVIHEVCERVSVRTQDIDVLITNQPNTFFLRNWREACLLPRERHLDTFAKYANLFGAGIPITLDEGVREGKVRKGHLVCLAGFSHAGDYAAAVLIRWGGRASE
jgi:3-oxoacyl-[acyl-carrier-protein] synthase-3